MFHFSSKLITMAVIFSCLFFYLVSCGQNSVTQSISPTPNEEFNQFVEVNRLKSASEFVEWWNTVENKKYKFYLYSQVDPNSPITWPDNSSSSEIYNSKIINCFRINVLIKPIFDNSTLVKVYQPSVDYDHVYLLLQNGDIIDNTNDGGKLWLTYTQKK